MDSVNVRVLIVATFLAILAGCKSDSPLDPLERASRIDGASAVNVGGVVGTDATPAPVVRVTDDEGDPVSDVPVSFTLTAGSGTVNPSVVTTDADGRASTTWTLGAAASSQTLKASVGTLEPVVFTAKAVAGPPTRLQRTGGDNQIAAIGVAASSLLRARVTDSFDNPISGVSVSFSVISGGGSITPATVTSDSTGSVSASWTMGPVEGVQTVQAQVAGVSVLFTADTFTCPGATAPAPCTGLGDLIFVRTLDNQIYRINVDGTGLTRLTSDGNNSYPAWSPDGKRIAFIRFAPGVSDVFLMNADGSNLVRRTTGGQYYMVTWSADGLSLAVEAATGGDSLSISTMSADGATSPLLLIANVAHHRGHPMGR